MLPIIYQNPLLRNSISTQERIGIAGFGSQPSIRSAFSQMISGNRKSITCTTIRAAKDWCLTLKIGSSPQRGFG
jgi:hypothetical protein